MASVALSKLPTVLQITKISSTDTNPISICPAVAGKTVKLWGLTAAVGTTAMAVTIGSNATALSGAMSVTGIMLGLPSGKKDGHAYPHFESAMGETITITPGAIGLNGMAYWTQN